MGAANRIIFVPAARERYTTHGLRSVRALIVGKSPTCPTAQCQTHPQASCQRGGLGVVHRRGPRDVACTRAPSPGCLTGVSS